MSFLLGTFLQSFQRSAFTILIRFRDILYKLVLVLLTSTVIVWLSVFLYGTFYYTYMPAVSHVKPVHLQFGWCDQGSLCSFPTANVTLIKKGQEQLLMRGQQYKVYLDLEMPESPVNQKLGMFMVNINFISRNGDVVHVSSRSAMLRYKSPLHQMLSTLFFTPLLLVGSAEEKQMVNLELCDFYEEDSARPAMMARIEIQNKHVEIYSAQLRIYAHFTGLRYLMFHWPVVSAVVGIGTNLFFLSIVALLSWYRYLVSHESHEVVVRVGFDEAHISSMEKRRSQVKEFLMREKQRQSRLKASFSAFDVTSAAQSRMQLQDDALGRSRTLSLDLLPRDPAKKGDAQELASPVFRRQRKISGSKQPSDMEAIEELKAERRDNEEPAAEEKEEEEEVEADVVDGIPVCSDSPEESLLSFDRDEESDILTMADIETADDVNETPADMHSIFKSDYSLGPLRKRSFVEHVYHK